MSPIQAKRVIKKSPPDKPEFVDQLDVRDTVFRINSQDSECELNYAIVSSSNDDPSLDSLIYVHTNFYSITGDDFDNVKMQIENDGYGLCEMQYHVNYNGDGIFDISYDMMHYSAYLSFHYKNICLDLHGKRKITLKDIVLEDQYERLAINCNSIVRQEVLLAKEKVKAEDEEILDYFSGIEFEESILEEFTINEDGITVYKDFDFPHYAKAYEPSGVINLTWSDLDGYLNKDLDFVQRMMGLEKQEEVL